MLNNKIPNSRKRFCKMTSSIAARWLSTFNRQKASKGVCRGSRFGIKADKIRSLKHFRQKNILKTLKESDLIQVEMLDSNSVTRFGKIRPLLQKIKSLWQLFSILFSIWHHFYHSLADFQGFWVNFHCYLWLNIEQTILNLVPLDSKEDRRTNVSKLFQILISEKHSE